MIPSFLQGRRGIIAALVVTSLVLITLDLRGSSMIDGARSVSVDLIAPIRGVMSAIFSPVRRAWHGIIDYESVKEENDRLRERVEEQEGASIEAEAQIRDYEALRAFNNLPVRSDIPLVPAEVIGDPPQNFEQQTIEINQGSNKGIQVGMAVITPAGLVGRILRVTPNRSVVRLMTDPEFNAGVKVSPAPVAVPTDPAAAAAPPAAPAVDPAAPVDPAAHHGRPEHDRGASAGHRAPAHDACRGTSSGVCSREQASGGSRPSAS